MGEYKDDVLRENHGVYAEGQKNMVEGQRSDPPQLGFELVNLIGGIYSK